MVARIRRPNPSVEGVGVKGIVIAGGMGTRVHPLTLSTSKCLLPVYNKPMVYYPVSALMMAGIRDLLVISRPRDRAAYEFLFRDGTDWGMRITYGEQPDPRGGIAEAFLIGEAFVGDESCALVLGDNVFMGDGLPAHLQNVASPIKGATIFVTRVKQPEHYGIVTFDSSDQPIRIEEKPSNPSSNWAVTGLYFYDNQVLDIARQLQPSARGELEISDINQTFLSWEILCVERLGEDVTWFDAGTIESLYQATSHVRQVERHSGQPVGFPELVALANGWIDHHQVSRLGERYKHSHYGRFLKRFSERADTQ